MATLVTRATKGTELTHGELDGNFPRNATAKATAYTVAEADNRDTIEVTGTTTITLPAAATIVAAADTGDFEVTIKNVSGTTTIAPAGVETIDGVNANIVLISLQSITLKVNSAGTGWNIIDNSLCKVTATITTPTVAGGDAFIMNDADVGTVQVDIDNVDTYLAASTKTLTNKTINAANNTITNIGQAEISASAIGQGELKVATGSVSTTTAAQLTLPGGNYGFYPQVQASDANQGVAWTVQIYNEIETNSPTTYSTEIYIDSGGTTGTKSARQTYIQASPPYNLGNGDVPLFVFLVIDNSTSEVISTYIAQDPPWANNGPTSIRPDFIENNKKYKRVMVNAGGQAISGKAERIAAIRSGQVRYENIEIDYAYKNSDMGLIPHPFRSQRTGTTIVMLDPLSRCVDDLFEMNRQDISVSEIFHDNLINIGNTGLPINTPPGVIAVSASWKLTP